MCLVCDLYGGRRPDCMDRVSRSSKPKIERLKGGWYEFLTTHRRQCQAALAEGGDDQEHLIAQLYNRATDVRALDASWHLLECQEKHHPGKTGFAPAVGLTDKQIRCALKHLRRKLRRPEYVPFD